MSAASNSPSPSDCYALPSCTTRMVQEGNPASLHSTRFHTGKVFKLLKQLTHGLQFYYSTTTSQSATTPILEHLKMPYQWRVTIKNDVARRQLTAWACSCLCPSRLPTNSPQAPTPPVHYRRRDPITEASLHFPTFTYAYGSSTARSPLDLTVSL
ncbi:hypothetical protein J6590_010151 [Homalodisca vitripennis]|nr:hypothetical protein J6590_010151 [Homalodisca vitripennis]